MICNDHNFQSVKMSIQKSQKWSAVCLFLKSLTKATNELTPWCKNFLKSWRLCG